MQAISLQVLQEALVAAQEHERGGVLRGEGATPLADDPAPFGEDTL